MEKLIRSELKQRAEEGLDIAPYERKLAELLQQRPAELPRFLDELAVLPSPLADKEPSDLAGIQALRPPGVREVPKVYSYQELFDRIYGGWLARCAGCQLGKPVEMHPRENVKLRAELCGNWPVTDYFHALVNPPDEVYWGDWWTPANPSLLDDMKGMARDDDMDYTIVGLRLLETRGFDFSSDDVGEYWIRNLPYAATYTAERTAYLNYVNGLRTPQTATYRNPAREWIGASIRADIYGLVCPGRMEQAAALAYRDAAFSHTANGIYGAMCYAAMIAAAFVCDRVEDVIEAGLREIPRDSRLAQVIRETVRRAQADANFETTLDWIYATQAGYQGCHMINNAAVTILGLVIGQGDITKTLGYSVMGGWDTDCTAASAGCIVGVMRGAKAIPPHWTAPLQDRVKTIVAEVHQAKISDLARRTQRLAERNLTAGRYQNNHGPASFIVEEW